MCDLSVVEAASPLSVTPGTIYIGKGGADMVIGQRGGKLTLIPKPESRDYLWHPSVELLGRSVLEHCDPSRVVAVMLTGMGYDGADAFTEIKKRGGASLVLPADKVAAQINVWAGR